MNRVFLVVLSIFILIGMAGSASALMIIKPTNSKGLFMTPKSVDLFMKPNKIQVIQAHS